MRKLLLACAAAAVASFSVPASALVITPAGASLGFSVTPVVTGMPSSGLGPIGITVLPNGNILTVDVANGINYVFPDADNQTIGAALFATPGGTCCGAYATSNGWAWGGNSGHLVRFNNDGTIAQSYASIGVSNGMWTNPVNGHLLIANGSIHDVDVSNIAAPIDVSIPGTFQADGVTVSPDGQIVYTSGIVGFRISDGAQVFGPHGVAGADGMGIIISSNAALDGKLVVNTTNGNVVLVDPTGVDADLIIADTGTRGDYTTNDPNGSLLLTQVDSIWRLTCGANCAIGSTPTPAPEPASIAVLAAALIGLGAARRRSR